MERELYGLLVSRMDIFARMSKAFEGEVEPALWKDLCNTIQSIMRELLGEGFLPEVHLEAQVSAYKPDWQLPLQGERQDWECYPSFWFPQDPDNVDTFALFGLGDALPLHASIWAQPLSEFVGDLATVRRVWDDTVRDPLMSRGDWKPYGARVTKPNGDWGMQHLVVLDHRQIAEAGRGGDLRPALALIEKLVNDFVYVSPAITKLVQELRSTEGR